MPYKAFKTTDGDILLGGGNDRLYGIICERFGKPQWVTDERFKTNALRVQNRDTLEAMIEEETKKKTTQEWLDILDGAGLRKLGLAKYLVIMGLTDTAYAAINDVQDTLNHEHGTKPNLIEQENHVVLTIRSVLARDMVKEVDHPSCGPLKLVNTPVKWSESKPGIRMPPPTLGQHTDEILGEFLGMKEGEIEELKGEGVIA